MRLLRCDDGKLALTTDLVDDIPPYAILSHTWGPDTEEVTFKDVVNGTGQEKVGYSKIRFCADQARHDSLQYFWVDTCCIDKSNNNELHAAINSMFRWYQNAARCYVYLGGIPAVDDESSQQPRPAWESAFRAHRWFTRGWTLQELLAPRSVEFFTQDHRRLGDKKTLEQQICEITGIPKQALRNYDLGQFGTDERFRWADTRQTRLEEDSAYSLLGIFGVFMPLIYGEGKAHAVRRLRREIADAASRDNEIEHQRTDKNSWMVPFERNPSFTGREPELNRLSQMLFTGQQTAKVAISGLGGVGKTQLALELVYRTREKYKDCSIVWIPATSQESLKQAYLNAAGQLGIPGYDDSEADVIGLMRDHLSSKSAGQWLLVFDNADDIGIWVDEPSAKSRRLIDSLPRSRHGSIIFTTRDKKTAVRLVGPKVVELSEMDEESCEELLEKYLGDQDLSGHEGDVATLLCRLTYLPLAIVQAAAYIQSNGISVGDYLSLLEEQEEDVIELLSEDFKDEWRYRDIKNPVATTFLISFNQLRQRDPLAADYLSFMACVDAKDIPHSLLPPGPSRKKEIDAMGTLQGYSFIAKRSAGSPVNIHRLVHLATRNWLRNEGLLSSWVAEAIMRLENVLQYICDDNRATWRSYMPHVYYVLGSTLPDEDDEYRLYLQRSYGICLWYDGRFQEAESYCQQVMEINRANLGTDHINTLIDMAHLVAIYNSQARWEEAEKLNIQVVEARKRKLGADHPDTLNGIANLAWIYEHQGKLVEAEKLQVQVVRARKRKLGADHPETLNGIANLAVTYRGQGRLGEAEKLLVHVIEARTRKLDADHPDTLHGIANLAGIYRYQERLEEAEKLQNQVVEARKRTLGADHPDTLNGIAKLALTYRGQGKLGKAEKLMVQVVEARKRKLGADHPDTLINMAHLAMTYGEQGRLDSAGRLGLQAMEGLKARLGKTHPNTLYSMMVVAVAWKGLGRNGDALALLQTRFDLQRQVLGPSHPDTLDTLRGLKAWRQDTK